RIRIVEMKLEIRIGDGRRGHASLGYEVGGGVRRTISLPPPLTKKQRWEPGLRGDQYGGEHNHQHRQCAHVTSGVPHYTPAMRISRAIRFAFCSVVLLFALAWPASHAAAAGMPCDRACLRTTL